MSTGDPVVVEKRMPSQEDFYRLENKVDRLTDAVGKLVLIEERQTNQVGMIAELKGAFEIFKTETIKDLASSREKHDTLEKTVSSWVNRGIGVWFAAGIIFAIVKFGAQIFGMK